MDDQHQSFEQHKQLDDNGAEYWSARSLSKLLEYSEFRHFQAVLARAKDACTTSGYEVEDHFEDSLVLVSIGSGAQRKLHDHMGSTELAANLFRATQAEEKMRRDEVQGKHHANQVHLEVGRKVRETIADLGGTMPEDLPTPANSIKQIEAREKKDVLE